MGRGSEDRVSCGQGFPGQGWASLLGRSEHPLPGSWWAGAPCGCPCFVPITWGIWWPVLCYGFSWEMEE